MEYILYNAKVFSMNSAMDTFDAILISNDKIAHTGTFSECLANAEDIDTVRKFDLSGKVVLPGFIDTHTHFYQLAKLHYEVNLSECSTFEDTIEYLRDYKQNMNPLIKWINGSGWSTDLDKNEWNRYALDEIFPDIPVSLKSWDLHTKLCNSCALDKAGITKDFVNQGKGKIGRCNDGTPDGFLYEEAWDLINAVAIPLPKKLMIEAINKTIADCWKMGLTGVHFMENEDSAQLLKEVSESGIPFRFFWHFPESCLEDFIDKGIQSYSGTEMYKICGLKLYADGSVGSHSAFMSNPYPDGSFGMLTWDEEELRNTILKAAENGISSTVHAIGDKCNTIVIDAIVNAVKKTGLQKLFRVEHAQFIQDFDIEKLSEYNIYTAMQPIHMKYDIKNIDKTLPHSQNLAYRIRDILSAGINTGFGSDAPVAEINPFSGIYAAIKRRAGNNPTENSWHSEQSVHVMEAIKGYTADAATGSMSEDKLGTIETGKLADLIVIEDFEKKPDEFWLDAKSLMTIVNGDIVYNCLERIDL